MSPTRVFRPLAGKPLFRWILDTLLSIDGIDQVVINTDARPRPPIATAKRSFREDLVSMNRVLADDVATIDADVYLMTHTTNPLLGATTIRRGIAEFLAPSADGRADSAFTVNRFQSRFYRQDGSPVNHDPANLIRTQDLEPWFEENSNLYVSLGRAFAMAMRALAPDRLC